MERRPCKLLSEAVGRVQQFIWASSILRENSFTGRHETIVLSSDDTLCTTHLPG